MSKTRGIPTPEFLLEDFLLDQSIDRDQTLSSALSHLNQGKALLQQKEYKDALLCYNHALSLFQKVQTAFTELRECYEGISCIYLYGFLEDVFTETEIRNAGDDQEPLYQRKFNTAIDCYKKALRHFNDKECSPEEKDAYTLKIYTQLIRAYELLGNEARALKYALKKLEISKRVNANNPRLFADSLQKVGECYALSDRSSLALSYYLEANKYYIQGKNQPEITYSQAIIQKLKIKMNADFQKLQEQFATQRAQLFDQTHSTEEQKSEATTVFHFKNSPETSPLANGTMFKKLPLGSQESSNSERLTKANTPTQSSS